MAISSISGALSPLSPKLPSIGGGAAKPAGADFGSALKQAVGALDQLGLATIAVAAIGILFLVSTVGHTADSAVAFSGLSNDDMAAVVTKLKDAKIPYELADGGLIRVPSGQVQEARLATAGMGLGGK